MNDVVINKIQSIQRCVQRARAEYGTDLQRFESDFTRQDAALLNVLRACEQAIDLANHVIKSRKLGIPSSSAESFDLLQAKSIIDSDLSEKLKKMIVFRNTLVHQYQRMDFEIVKSVILSGLDDLVELGDRILESFSGHAQ